jgi:hypothetical protein
MTVCLFGGRGSKRPVAPAFVVLSTVRSEHPRRLWWALLLGAAVLAIVIIVLVGAFGDVVDAISPRL